MASIKVYVDLMM